MDARPLPHSIEAEQSLIGALLIRNDVFDRIGDLIREADFYRDDHRRIFGAIRKLIESGRPADVVTVADALAAANLTEVTGGLSYLGEIANATPSAANARAYAETVARCATLRALIEAADALRDACLAPSDTAPAKIAQATEQRLSCALDRASGEPVTAADAAAAALATADDIQRTGRDSGLRFGFPAIDRLTRLRAGQLHVIAARPSIGKTAFALNVALSVASAGKRVAVFSLEMSASEIAERLLSSVSGVPLRALQAGPTEAEWAALASANSRPAISRILIDDKGAITPSYLRARCRRLHRAEPLSLIVVDYLQLMQAETGPKAKISHLPRTAPSIASNTNAAAPICSPPCHRDCCACGGFTSLPAGL